MSGEPQSDQKKSLNSQCLRHPIRSWKREHGVFSASRPMKRSKYEVSEMDAALLKNCTDTFCRESKLYSEFITYLKDIFEKACKEAARNRDCNFWIKRQFVRLVHLLVIIQMLYLFLITVVFSSPIWIFLINHLFDKKHSLNRLLQIMPLDAGIMAGIEAVILLAIIVSSVASNKWIQVKRYQETWARFALLKHNLSCEMLKYCYELEPYQNNKDNKYKKLFIVNVITITDHNMIKFVKNIEENEHNLIDDILSLKASVKTDE